MVFVFSFLGISEITLPSSSWTSKSDKLSDTKGIIGIFYIHVCISLFFMYRSHCRISTGRISKSPLLGPFWSCLDFSLALAILFVFCCFPIWLNSLPKSGSWMTKCQGSSWLSGACFALKFCRMQTCPEIWMYFYEVFIWLYKWFFCIDDDTLSVWLIRFPHDSPVKKLSALRFYFAGAVMAMTLYLDPVFI